MAVAPYQPFPTAEPTLRPAQQVEVNAPAAAFGTNVGQALSSVGANVEHAGDELFNTAVAVNKMRVENDVMARTTQYEKDANEAHAQFTQLRGEQAAQALPDYYKNLEKLRMDNRGDLPLFAQVMYDNQTRNMQGRLYFNAAGHAGEQLTQQVTKNAKSSLDLAKQTASQFTNDEAAFNAQQQTIDDRALEYYKKAVGPVGSDADIRATDSYKDFIRNEQSDVYLERIRQMAISNPMGAQQLFNKYQQAGLLRGEKVPQIDQWTRQRTYEVAAPQIARGVRDGSGYDWGSGPVSLPRAREAIGSFENGGRYDTASTVETAHGHALGKYQVMSGYLQDYLKQAGLPPMSEGDFLKSQAAQDTVFENVFGANMQKYGSFNEAASRWFTGKSLADARASGVADALGTNVDSYLKNTNAYLAKSSSLDQQVQAGINIAKQQDNPDPALQEHVKQHLLADHNQDASIQRAALYDAKEGVAEALTSGKVKTVDDLMADPKLAGTLANAPATFRAQLPAMINRYNAGVNKAANDEAYTHAMGLLYSRDDVDVQKFQELDPTTLGVSNEQTRAIWKAQAQLRKAGAADPKVGRAYDEIQRQFPDSTPRRDEKDRYLQFNGALATYIEQYQAKFGKEPGVEDIHKFGEALTKPDPSHGWRSHPEAFEKPVANDFQEHYSGLGMRDEEIRQLWNKAQAQIYFNNLYKGSTSSEKNGGPATSISK